MKTNLIISDIKDTLIKMGSTDNSFDKTLLKSLQTQVELLETSLSATPKKKYRRVKEINEFLEAVLNKIPDPVFIKNEEHIWVYLNDSACELFGFDRKNLIGKSDYDIFIKEEADEYWKVDNIVFKTGKDVRNEEFQTHPITGKRRIIDTKKTLYIDSEGEKYIVGIIRDITELKEAKEQLENEMKTKEKIFMMIAHDLKEPFNALLGFTSLLKSRYSELDDSKRKSFIENINKIGWNTFRLIQNILDWTAIETGKIEYRPKNVNIKSIIDSSLNLNKQSAIEKKIKIKTEISDINLQVFADQYLLSTVLRNLISNAIKFSNTKGTLIVKVSGPETDMLTCCVIDNGIGISRDDADKLFSEPEAITTPEYADNKGIGLGLVLCKEFVTKNHGEIWFEPNQPEGSKFCFTIPAFRQQ